MESDKHSEAAAMLSEKQTAKIASPISGDKLYQQRARAALPLLVRQATTGHPVTYTDLAEELGMPNPRNLNYVLGSIVNTIELFGRAWKESVPPIQCLVVNKNTGLPGEGIGWFLIKTDNFRDLTRAEKEKLVDSNLSRIYAFPRWKEMLETLELSTASSNYAEDLQHAAELKYGEGESEDHKKLKKHIEQNPHFVGLKSCSVRTEHPLPSGDRLDVSFQSPDEWVAAEVKTARSVVADITRGLYQCVKYRAVMAAVDAAEGEQRVVRVVLFLEDKLPPSLIPLRNLLGIEVIDNIGSLH